MDDTRKVLEQAAQEREACGLARREGPWIDGVLCDVEASGVVVHAPGHDLRGGEEVRLAVEVAGVPLHFEASVLRTGLPGPDRANEAVLLGFLSAVAAGEAAAEAGGVVSFRLPGGGALSLLAPPVRLIDLGLSRLEVQVPADFGLVFAVGGEIRVVLGAGNVVYEAVAHVDRQTRVGAHLVYSVAIDAVPDAEAHRLTVGTLRGALEG